MPTRFFTADNDPLAESAALASHIERALAARPMGGWELECSYRLVQRWFKPRVYGTGQLPRNRCLFVGNHGLFAIDGAIIIPLMLRDYNRYLRPMGDKFLFTEPRLADLLLARGATMGHPKVCDAMMDAGHDILVFPGGAHEAVKSERDNYTLQWKERIGFVRLAARHGYSIVPFGLVGPDDFYQHLIEGEDIPDSKLGHYLQRLGLLDANTRSDVIPPLARGMLGSPLPRPQPCYLGFGKAIDLSSLRGKRVGKRRLEGLRDLAAAEIEQQLIMLLAERERMRDDEGLLRRVLNL